MSGKNYFSQCFDPEHPWIRAVFAKSEKGYQLDDDSSRRLAKSTGWDQKDENGHRYHNAVVMMDVNKEDLMYFHLYKFVKDFWEPVTFLKRRKETEKEQCFFHFGVSKQLPRDAIDRLSIDDVMSIALMVCSFSLLPEHNADTHQTEITKQGRRDVARMTIEKGEALLEEDAPTPAAEADMSTPSLKKTTGKDRARAGSSAQKPAMDVSTPRATPRATPSPMALCTTGSSGSKKKAGARSIPASGKHHGPSRGDKDIAAATPRSEGNLKSAQTYGGFEDEEDYQTYLSRPRQMRGDEENLGILRRHAEKTRSDATKSPLADKSRAKMAEKEPIVIRSSSSSEVPAWRAGRKWKDGKPVRPMAVLGDVPKGRNEQDVPTASDSDDDPEHRRPGQGGRTKKTNARKAAISPSKRTKDSPTETPESPTKRSRVVSNLTQESVNPLDGTLTGGEDEIPERQRFPWEHDDSRGGFSSHDDNIEDPAKQGF